VTLAGLAVQPGDLLHGGVNGVLVIPDSVADRVVDQALRVRRRKEKCWNSYENRG
jgi:regulator of RNase E activity RraA